LRDRIAQRPPFEKLRGLLCLPENRRARKRLGRFS
jgi:hypothetical protein